MNADEFENYLKNSENLIIFGTGMMGMHLHEALKKLNISITAFCDNNMEIVGTTKDGVPICSLDEIKKQYKSPVILVSVLLDKYQRTISKQLESNQIFDYYSLVECLEKISTLEMPDRWMNMIMIQRSMQKYCSVDSELTYMDHFGVDITEVCNLRCRGCAAHVPDKKNPIHRDKKEIFHTIDRVAETLDKVVRFDIVGGESLLHPNVYEFIAHAQSKQNFHYVNVYTNGTIVPKKEELMKLDHSRLLFYISNYGELSNKKDEIIQLLEELDIGYHCPNDMKWYDSYVLEYRNKTEEELEFTFQHCDNDCPTLHNGKFFYCFKALDVYQTNNIPNTESSYVDLMDTNIPIAETKKAMRQLLYGQKYLMACNWCVGGLESERTEIPVAEQL